MSTDSDVESGEEIYLDTLPFPMTFGTGGGEEGGAHAPVSSNADLDADPSLIHGVSGTSSPPTVIQSWLETIPIYALDPEQGQDLDAVSLPGELGTGSSAQSSNSPTVFSAVNSGDNNLQSAAESIPGDEAPSEMPLGSSNDEAESDSSEEQEDDSAASGPTDVPLTVIRDPFHISKSNPGYAGRQTGSSMTEYPPWGGDPAGDHRRIVDKQLSRLTGIDTEGLVDAQNATGNELQKMIDARHLSNQRIRDELQKKKRDLKDLHESLRRLKEGPSDLYHESSDEVCGSIEKLEWDISELDQQNLAGVKDLEKLIFNQLGATPPADQVSKTLPFARLAKPISANGTTPGLTVLPGTETSFEPKAPEVLIPDWFHVFETYELVELRQPTEEERFRALLNVIHRLEEKIKRAEARTKSGMVKFDREWHDPAPGWSTQTRRRIGG